MTRAFGFDDDSALYESLERKVLADEAARKEALRQQQAQRQPSLVSESSLNSDLEPNNTSRRHSSLNPFSRSRTNSKGADTTPKNDAAASTTNTTITTTSLLHVNDTTTPTFSNEISSEAALSSDNASKKSVGEKLANFIFNGGRRTRQQQWGEQRVGMSDGRVVGHVVRDSGVEEEGGV